ncbi:larval cuticle protein LCP-22-like [Cimex lectularius]|uniref:CPR type cuticle protein n=1 Tax=Cimex lectularius TaxID=79782 RepID=A0A8I6RKN8_CIMLE|nr:larval cuticle protein LCP-22-like [Cimex lectularius]
MRTIALTLLLCACAYGQQQAQKRQDSRPAVYQNQEYKDQEQAEDRPRYQNNFQTGYNQGFQNYENQNRNYQHDSTPVPAHLPEPRVAVTPIPIIRLNKQQSLDGSYKSSYETGNSIVAEETGFVKNLGVEGVEGLVQYGSYSYTDPDGRVITVRYTADEGGFRPEGDHLPTPPPVPAEVQKGLDIIFESIRLQAEKEASEKHAHNTQQESANYPESRDDDGSYRPEYNN